MMRLRLAIVPILSLLAFLTVARGQEPIRFGRTPDISPDGKLVAFSYLGDIWIVETIGGVARPVTMHEAHDIYPAFSPDGRRLAFSSNRHGSYDVFVVPNEGGKPTRLTFDSANDMVCGWSPDGAQVLFASTRTTAFPPRYELYSVAAAGGPEKRVTAFEGKGGVYSPKGDQIAYVRGPGTWYRKGYRGSSNDDIWICNADGTNNRQFTREACQDSSPMWSPDGQYLYYVSEYPEAPANIVRQEISGQSKPQLMTFHKDDAVHRARISANGQWIVYECGTDLCVVSTREGELSRKVHIGVHADDKENSEKTITFTNTATEFMLSKDEKHVAFVVHGEIFLMPIAGGKATRLTDHPAFDHGIAWEPYSKKIIFASDRDGQEDLYTLDPDDKDNPELVKAHKFKVTRLTNSPEAEIGTSFSPDGKRVTFIRAGKLVSVKPDGTDEKILVKDVQVIDYEWSPDSKWIAYSRVDGSFASEMYISPAEGGVAKNVTRYATENYGITWSGDARKLDKIGFLSQRRGVTSMHVLALQKPAAPNAPDGKDAIDWEDIHLRVTQAAPLPAEEGAISRDGGKVAFRARSSSGDDLWVAGTNGSSLTRVTYNNVQPSQLQWSRLPDLLYFRDGAGQFRSVRAGAMSTPTVIPFRAKMTVRRDEEFSEMFEQSWRALQEHFYDKNFHGIAWLIVRDKYRPVVKHIALKEDLYDLISLMFGELNTSHVNIYGPPRPPEEVTADLGLIFDEKFPGPRLKIAEVLKRGPADQRGIELKPGDIIGSIDRVELTGKLNLSKLLNDKVGESVTLQVTANPLADFREAKAWRRVDIQATTRRRIADLMYERWVEHNAKRVAERSKEKVGYIHIPSMDEAGMDRFVRALYSDNFDKEAIVLDVRYNNGGFTHDQVLNYLGGKQHTVFRQRNGGEGSVLRSNDRKWSKPLVLLINNQSYSDAEIFPSAFRTLGLGKLVGEPTGGLVIGTSSVRLIDGSRFSIPRTGVFTLGGINMEKQGVTPDVPVPAHPDELAKGLDVQLDKAVDIVQQDVFAWKKKQETLSAQAPTASTAGAPATPLTSAPGK